MAGRCALCLCTALAIAAAASPADGVGQSQGQQVSDDQRPELVDWPHFGRTQKAFLVSDRFGAETSAGNSYSPVKSSSFQASSDFRRPKQVIDKLPRKAPGRRSRRSTTTTTTTVHPFLRVQPKESWEDKWPQTHSFWVEGPDKKTLKKMEKAIKAEEKEKKEAKKKKKAEKKKEAEKKKRRKPRTTPKPAEKPFHPWRNKRNLRQLIQRTAAAETETFRVRGVNVPSGLHERSQQQLNRVQQSGPAHRRSRLPRVLRSADSNSHVH